jgi:TetR/AcrR family transcriptional regulator, repressor for uid operon
MRTVTSTSGAGTVPPDGRTGRAPGLAEHRLSVADGDPTTERILDATHAHLLEVGLRRTSVEDVAKRAGVARITIYRRFDGRDELIRAVLLREGRRVLAEVEASVAGIDDLDDQLVEGFAVILTTVRDHPLLARLLDSELDATLPSLTVHGGPVVALGREYLAGHLLSAPDGHHRSAVDVRVTAELVVRLTLSFVLTPESVVPLATADDARAFARRFVLPALHPTPTTGGPPPSSDPEIP